jgi:hypothetical protein
MVDLAAKLKLIACQAGHSLSRASELREAPTATDWASRIASLALAQRVRDGRRVAAQTALPGEDVAPGVRRVRAIETHADGCAVDHPVWERVARAGRPLVFLDTETTGLAGGTGTLVFLLGLATLDERGVAIDQWLLTRPGGEAAWLDAVAASLPDDFVVVSFNGKAFDLPLLAARYRMQRRRDPFAGREHWDLLFPTRRAFDTRWPDCRLQTAERRLLGLERVDDLPGSFAPQAFASWLRAGDARLLTQVIAHNRRDVASLARLLEALALVHRDPLRFDADAGALGRHLAALGRRAEARALVEPAARTQPHARRVLAELLRRERRHDEAAEHLEALAAGGCAHAIERLAKIEEHVRGDYARALEWAERLGDRRRIARLERKLRS